ncbi:CheR family methyltransferase [Pseudopedobacter beijingensis]|uniref:CheR family methyltransferase n=1 Tax=Pseudopedobacter beijingensis TaxID=1207056 RepID=A0ABW4ID53_9SPHI
MSKLTNITYEELDELVVMIRMRFGFDFSLYSKASLKRRFERIINLNKWSLFDIKDKIVNDNSFIHFLITEITVNVTEMFRDASLFQSLRENVIPYLSSYQRIKVWHPGVSSGEELYSFSILFKEMGLYDRSFFYGTDVNQEVLEEAKTGIYSLKKMKAYAENFYKVGLKGPFSKYYTVLYDNATITEELKNNALFSVHNLVSDGVFNEFQLVSCRNVLIYFQQELQDRVLNLLIDSLCPLGFLVLGSKETIRSVEIGERLRVIDAYENIYQKI